MRVVTMIDVPDYVYIYFAKQAKLYPHKSPEELMAGYLARSIRQKLYREAKKEAQISNESK